MAYLQRPLPVYLLEEVQKWARATKPPDFSISTREEQMGFLQSFNLISGVSEKSVKSNLAIIFWIASVVTTGFKPRAKAVDADDLLPAREDEFRELEALHVALVILTWFWSFGVDPEL